LSRSMWATAWWTYPQWSLLWSVGSPSSSDVGMGFVCLLWFGGAMVSFRGPVPSAGLAGWAGAALGARDLARVPTVSADVADPVETCVEGLGALGAAAEEADYHFAE